MEPADGFPKTYPKKLNFPFELIAKVENIKLVVIFKLFSNFEYDFSKTKERRDIDSAHLARADKNLRFSIKIKKPN